MSISGQGSLGENSILVNVPAPPQDATEQGQSFAEVVALMRDANGLGEMKGDHVRSSVLRMPHARKSLILFLMLFLYLPCSGISMRRPMETWTSWLGPSGIVFPTPLPRERKYYRTEDVGFDALFEPHAGLTLLTMMRRPEMMMISATASSRLFSKLEMSSSCLAGVMSWMDQWRVPCS